MSNVIDVPPLNETNRSLNGCVYLVTGASGGLGYKTSLALAKQGATVVVSGRNNDKLDQLYDDIENADYPQAAIIPFDLEQTDEEAYKQLGNSIYNVFKRLDGIVHLASKIGNVGPLASQETHEWLNVQQVNVNACFMLNKIFLPLLLKAEHASITFISDSSARTNNAYWGAYGVSKNAIESFSSILADELEDTSVNCNVLIPGPSVLPIRKKTHPGEKNDHLTPSQAVADAVVGVILSDQTGQTFSL